MRAHRILLMSLAFVFLLAAFGPTSGATHADDAGSGGDAGNTFATATSVSAAGRFSGGFAHGDRADFYRFWVDQGDSLSIDIYAGLITGFLQVNDADRRLGVRLWDPNGVLLDTPNSNVGDSRVTLAAAPIAGEYRLSFHQQELRVFSYSVCFAEVGAPCVDYGLRPIALGTALPYPLANVLLVPPAHGNPTGTETVLDYLDATLRGIYAWEPAIDLFIAKYPAYAYLDALEVHVEVFDGTPRRAGYDVVIVWGEYTGPIFRGVAANFFGGGVSHTALCELRGECALWASLEPVVHDATRLIMMSVFASAPRSGQVVPDWPEVNDIQNVAMHEFAHTYGLGHTQTWLASTGPDLMNSPYPLVFGDGDPLGDGGERTPLNCINSLDLYGMARLYAWLPGGDYGNHHPGGWAYLPSGMPYEMFCV